MKRQDNNNGRDGGGKALTNSYHKRLAYLENKKYITLAEYSKFKKFSHSNLINKAGRQTIEAF